jgi:type I restriction enzyme M protein
VRYAPITIPPGASFRDMAALKGTSDIGDQINKKIIAPLANANGLSGMPDFNDPTKLGSGKEMVERLTNLIAIFENPALDFSKNRAEGDDGATVHDMISERMSRELHTFIVPGSRCV